MNFTLSESSIITLLVLVLTALGSVTIYIVKLSTQASLDRARLKVLEAHYRATENIISKIGKRVARLSKIGLISNMKLNSLKEDYKRLDEDVLDLKKMLAHVEKRKSREENNE